MASDLQRETVFLALTRPQTFAGVTFSVFVGNAIVAIELFLIFKSFWILPIALVIHGLAALASVREPRIVDLWITRVSRCPRVRNHKLWRCNSYRA